MLQSTYKQHVQNGINTVCHCITHKVNYLKYSNSLFKIFKIIIKNIQNTFFNLFKIYIVSSELLTEVLLKK